MSKYLLSVVLIMIACMICAQEKANYRIISVDSGWAGNSVNTVVFRKNSLVTAGDTQYIAFYNRDGDVMLGKRKRTDSNWVMRKTRLKGNIRDAHNSISIMVDGAGYLHIAWGHHGNPLNYCKSISPGSLELTEKLEMTGLNEQHVTYPEFYKMPGGDLIFLYRDGSSGKGNLVLDRYDTKKQQWTQLHASLVDGEGKRNAYWQACVGGDGVIHLSWVWRETPDVASNHDMCYARSADGGKTWTTSMGNIYQLPVHATSAEYAYIIPQKSDLINQTSMCSDKAGNVFIATYWREKGDSSPQYHLVYKKNDKWQVQVLHFRVSSFSLSGGGTKRIPVSRPQIITWQKDATNKVALIFRDEERKNYVSLASCDDIDRGIWRVKDILEEDMGSWEPGYDTELWRDENVLGIFIQRTEQADNEGVSLMPPQMVKVLEWQP